VSNATGPIADLSYRSYEGTLDAPTQRWKVIAKQQMLRVIKHKGMWLCLAFSGWYYGIMIIALFIIDLMMQGGGNDASQALQQLGALDWKAQFLNGYSYGQMFFMFVAMIIGAGAIANDNRANALLVYLSKPCTKKDYILGKWMGVFIPVALAMFLPALLFWIYGAMNYREYGFISDDPWLLLRMLVICVFGAAFHASLVLGVSSLFNQGGLASATYVGAYFLTYMITVFIKIIMVQTRGDSGIAETFYYASIDGLNIGIAKIFLDMDGANLFIGGNDLIVDRPNPILTILVVAAISAGALWLVWKKVRAVEVVG
jgi:ABC-2 type transport system permease protein